MRVRTYAQTDAQILSLDRGSADEAGVIVLKSIHQLQSYYVVALKFIWSVCLRDFQGRYLPTEVKEGVYARALTFFKYVFIYTNKCNSAF